MITLQNILLRRGSSVLLKDVNWTIYPQQRIGLIGANGCGKSSLFAMLLNQLHADTGTLEVPRHLQIAHVAQETPSYSQSALEFTLDGDAELRSIQQQIKIAEEHNQGETIAALYVRLSEIDGYTANSRAAQLLDGLGFNHLEQQKSVGEFSGGWRVRLNLAKALMCRSDVLLLDEPTNHLDLDAVLWLENWLNRYTGTLLLISHDREFLDQVVGFIAHIANQELKVYAGNYSSFEKQRAAHILLQQAAYEKQQKQIAHLRSFVDRFGAKATKAKQAQSRVKAIARMELINVVRIESSFDFAFKKPSKCPNPLVYLDEARIAYGEKIVLKKIHLSIAPKDRIALLGPNGAGKTSLIRLLAGELKPSIGVRETGEGLKIGYFAQHQVDSLDLTETPLFHLKEIAPGKSEQELRAYLGSFGFVGNRVLECVKNFSGGEKSRLALGLLVWQQPNLLLLDEPTNHLDLDMRHALSSALQEYQGAMILVSHDRFLVSTTVDQLMLVANGELTNFDGDLNDYQKWLFEFRRQQESNPTENKTIQSRKNQRQENAKLRESRQPLMKEIKKLETELARYHARMLVIENELADPAIYEDANKPLFQKLLAEQIELNKKLNQQEELWLKACEDLESGMQEE